MITVAIANSGSRRECPAQWCQSKPNDLACLGCLRTPEELRRQVLQKQPDALLLDMAAFGGAGLDYARQLKSLLPKLAVIVLSAEKEPTTILAALRSGAQAFLAKPVSSALLAEAVRRLAVRRGVPPRTVPALV